VRSRIARTVLALAVLVPMVAFVGVVGVPWGVERFEFQQAKRDFANTWCATLGSDAPDFDVAVSAWSQYVERNRVFLESHWHVLGLNDWNVASYGPEEYQDVLMLEADVLSWQRYGGDWPPQWLWGYFPVHFSFFDFPGDAPPPCE